MQQSSTKRRTFDFMALLFGSRPTPHANPPQTLSGFLVGESKADRIERVANDATELLRRAYAGLEWSRRTMQPLGMGQRRWASAHAFLLHASCIYPDGTLVHPEQVMARRCLIAAREHHLYALKRGQYATPF